MGQPLKNPPIYFAVGQVRFNPILKLSDFLAGIQENFRKQGFPDFQPQKQVVLQVTMQNGQAVPVPNFQDRFLFRNVDKTKAFLLESDKLSFQCTQYEHFDSFSDLFFIGLNLLNDTVHLDFTERVGLRYLDRVTPTPSDTLDEYLVPGVLGLSNQLGGTAIHSYAETLCQIGDIKLMSRVVTQVGGLGFPPDLAPSDMVVAKRFQEYQGRHAVLDNDGFFEGRESYSEPSIRAHLDKIHTVIGNAFRATATKYAFEVWDK